MGKIRYKRLLALLLFILVIIPLCDIGEVNLGGGFSYFEEPSFIQYWERKATHSYDIPPYIMAYNNKKNYLFVKQRPMKYRHVMFTDSIYPNGRDTVYYYLANKKTKELTGPLLFSDMQSFLKQKNLEYLMDSLE